MGDYRTLLASTLGQIEEGIKLAGNTSVPKGIKKIICCGMGGSGIVSDVLATVLEPYGIEVVVYKSAYLPKHYFQPNTLVITSSYSGNTAETLSCYRIAVKEKVKMLIVASGGTLLASGHRQKIPVVQLPTGYLPRQAFYLQLFGILQVLVNSEIIPPQTTAINEFKRIFEEYPFARRSNAIAKNMKDTFPLVLSSPDMLCAATRWKTQLAENSKNLCAVDVFTELNHNTIESFDTQVKGVSLFIICHEREPKLIEKQIDVFVQLTRSQVDTLKTYTLPGRSLLSSILAAVHLGDWVSYQLAELKEVDPDPVTMITQLKSQLS